MKHAGDVDVSAAEPITEVELSAEELQALPSTSEVVLAQSSESSAVKTTPAPIRPAPVENAWLSYMRELSAAQILGSLAVVIVTSIAVSANFNDPTAPGAATSPASAWSPIPSRPSTIDSDEPQLLPAAKPSTFFKNPFDETEVFEFPPGTSYEEARAKVADLLMKRARERLAQAH